MLGHRPSKARDHQPTIAIDDSPGCIGKLSAGEANDAPRNILKAQFAWKHGDLVTTLYGSNLTDEHYVGAVNSGLRFAGPPLEYGLRVMKTF